VVSVFGTGDAGITSLELYDSSELLGSISFDVGLLSLSHKFDWVPATAGAHDLKAVAHAASGAVATDEVTILVGSKGQFIVNGGFEDGFYSTSKGEVGLGWGWFHSGGEASYGFYDETWAPVVYAGDHSQLIEINTLGRGASEADRYAGIYQTVSGLTPGATYRLSLRGMLRALDDDKDREGYNYRVEWGYDPLGGTDWKMVDNWIEVPWDDVHLRLDPGTMASHTVELRAPASSITIFVRAWKKWSTAGKELDVNLDSIVLEGYK
jgi:hypothetical protein